MTTYWAVKNKNQGPEPWVAKAESQKSMGDTGNDRAGKFHVRICIWRIIGVKVRVGFSLDQTWFRVMNLISVRAGRLMPAWKRNREHGS